MPDLAAKVADCTLDVGAPVALSRSAYTWHMSVSVTGILPYDNTCPSLIQCGSADPADALTQQGVRLARLIVTHADIHTLAQILRPIAGASEIIFEPGPDALAADFDTPTVHAASHEDDPPSAT